MCSNLDKNPICVLNYRYIINCAIKKKSVKMYIFVCVFYYYCFCGGKFKKKKKNFGGFPNQVLLWLWRSILIVMIAVFYVKTPWSKIQGLIGTWLGSCLYLLYIQYCSMYYNYSCDYTIIYYAWLPFYITPKTSRT